MREARLVINAASRACISIYKIRNDKAVSAYLRNDLVVYFAEMFLPVDPHGIVSGIADGRDNTTVPGFVHGLVEPHRDERSGRRCIGLFQFGQADVTRHGQSVAVISSPLEGFYPTLFLQIVCKEVDLSSLPIYGGKIC